MRPAAITLFGCALVISSACSSQLTDQRAPTPSQVTTASPTPNATNQNVTSQNATPSPNASPATKGKLDACTLLTSDEIKSVQGEAVKETKLSERTTGDFVTTQCYYELPTSSNSISLSLIASSSEKPGGVKEYWETNFGKDERKKDRDEEKKPQAQTGGEEESAPMAPVRGLGDEAFWSASRVGGALYVLKRDRYIRISVGGKSDAEAKLNKSKTLAQKALRRL
jgi:hypothetical protein